MKLVAISDIHGFLPKSLPPADVLVIAGDICPDLRPIKTQADWFKYQFVPWLSALKSQYRNMIVIPGNHDFIESYGEPVEWFFHDELNSFTDGPPSSFAYFCGSPQTIDLGRFKFYVNPYCLQLPGWAYQTSEDSLKDMYRSVQIGTDVIVSHGPPMDYCDKLEKIPGFHAGSYALKQVIKKVQPQAVICGHIHESFGKYQLSHVGTSDKTTIYNVAQLDINYKYHNRPVEFEIS